VGYLGYQVRLLSPSGIPFLVFTLSIAVSIEAGCDFDVFILRVFHPLLSRSICF
jgi:hypothetical protein